MESVMNTMADYLVHQSFQISALFLLVAAACWGLRKASAHWRYLLWLVVLAKCLVPALISAPLAVLPQQANTEPTAPRTTPTPAAAVASEFELAYEDSEPIAFPSMESPQDVTALPGLRVAKTTSSEELASSMSLRRRDWLTMAWLLGVALFLAYISVRVSTTHRKLKRSRRLADREIRVTVAALAEGLGLKMVPTVYMVHGIAQPFVWGWLRGSIYLPQQFVSSGTPEQRRAILTHELAHVARWDALANLVQIIAQAVFFFHPLVWWTNRRIRQEREKCCDEIVLAGLRTQPKQYSEAIVNALVTEYEASHSIPSLAVAGRLKNIEERIRTIMTPNKKFYRRPSWLAMALVLIVATCAVPTA
ncbi:MAG: M56 family metallopeptidase, partial [Planctomycetota bacterium]